jgi:hypothetical protein
LAKIFPILYLPLENSTTRITIIFTVLRASTLLRRLRYM